jgi:hypothetical protein
MGGPSQNTGSVSEDRMEQFCCSEVPEDPNEDAHKPGHPTHRSVNHMTPEQRAKMFRRVEVPRSTQMQG